VTETPHDPQHGSQARPDDLSDPLDPWARAVALGLGIAASGFGCYAVFASNNQAGTALLLAVGVILLLLGIQGTPLRSIGGGEYKVELARLRRRVVEAAGQAARQESPEVAAAVADALTVIDPGLVLGPPAGALYEQAVLQAFRRTGASVDPTHRAGLGDRGVDVRAQVAGGGKVNVQVVYRRRGAFGSRDIATSSAFHASGFDGGFLLVTNAPLSAEALQHNSALTHERQGPEVVTWNDERDDDLLARALVRNAS
jgi:hypothetical protein